MENKPAPHITEFSDYLKASQVVYDLKGKDKVEAIEELLDVLAKQKLIENKKLILTRIIDRENLVSTAIGSGVALPHARVDSGGEIAVAVGRSEKGIDFDAHDGQRVHLIILVVWNPTLPGLFNHLFAGLARFLIRAENRGRILAAKDKTELYEILAGSSSGSSTRRRSSAGPGCSGSSRRSSSRRSGRPRSSRRSSTSRRP